MNIVVWGLGNHAKNRILPAIFNSKHFHLYGVCSRNANEVIKASKAYDTRGWTSSTKMLIDKDIHAVYLSTPPSLHKNQGIRILESGKHLLCEKPLTMDYRETEELISKSISKNLCVSEALMYQYHPHFLEIKKILESNILGQVKKVSSSFTLPTLDEPGYRNIYELGASSLLDLGIYPISLIISLFKNQKLDLVNKKIESEENLKYDTSGEAEYISDNGTVYYINWAYDRSYKNEIIIVGENLELRSNFIFSKKQDHVAKINLYKKEILVKEITVDAVDHFALMLKSFRASIESEEIFELESHPSVSLSKRMDDIKNLKQEKTSV